MQPKTDMKHSVIRRHLLFVISLFINAFGVAFITKALLGTSPITSITYVLSLFTALTMGQWTIIINILLVALELPFMNRKWLRSELPLCLFQIPVTVFFGIFIDCSMNILHGLNPTMYFSQLLSLLIGCIILAVGIALEVKMNIAMTPGEYFVRIIAMRFNKDFGYIKLGFDTTLVLLACSVSIIFMSGVYGVREGTVIAALIVGPMVHWVNPHLHFLDKWVFEPLPDSNVSNNEKSRNIIITIAREYGSGGHLLGEMLAKKLDLKLYDKELIHLAARKSGINEDYIRKNEQTIPSFWLKYIFSQEPLDKSLSPDDVLFVAESKVIQEIADKESCIIIGRCADYILKEYPFVIKVFCYTDLQNARTRCVNEYGISKDVVESEIKRINKNRITHYEYYTGEKWGEPHHYHIMINTGCMSLQTASELIKGVYKSIKR